MRRRRRQIFTCWTLAQSHIKCDNIISCSSKRWTSAHNGFGKRDRQTLHTEISMHCRRENNWNNPYYILPPQAASHRCIAPTDSPTETRWRAMLARSDDTVAHSSASAAQSTATKRMMQRCGHRSCPLHDGSRSGAHSDQDQNEKYKKKESRISLACRLRTRITHKKGKHGYLYMYVSSQYYCACHGMARRHMAADAIADFVFSQLVHFRFLAFNSILLWQRTPNNNEPPFAIWLPAYGSAQFALQCAAYEQWNCRT